MTRLTLTQWARCFGCFLIATCVPSFAIIFITKGIFG